MEARSAKQSVGHFVPDIFVTPGTKAVYDMRNEKNGGNDSEQVEALAAETVKT